MSFRIVNRFYLSESFNIFDVNNSINAQFMVDYWEVVNPIDDDENPGEEPNN